MTGRRLAPHCGVGGARVIGLNSLQWRRTGAACGGKVREDQSAGINDGYEGPACARVLRSIPVGALAPVMLCVAHADL